MSVAEMERRFYELKGKLEVGAISEEDFRTELEKLRFQDVQNRWWMIGAQSGKWYVYNGTRWIPGIPPSDSPSMPLSSPEVQPLRPAPSSMTPSADEIKRPPRAPVAPAEHLLPHAPVQAAPRRTERAPSFNLPIRGPVLIGCAALLALCAVIGLWVAVDNVFPGKPISGLISGQPKASATLMRAVPSPVASTADGVTTLLTAGDEFLLRSQFDPAIAHYQIAAQQAPSNAVPLIRWSRALAFRGYIQDALAKANQATQRAPNDVEAQAQLARVMTWSGQANDALLIGEKAIQLDPKSSNAHAYLAEIYLTVNRPQDARTQAQLALQLTPQSAEAHRAQAWVLTLAGQKDAAIAEWRQTIALEPDLSFRHYEFAEVSRVYFKNAAESVPEYQKAIGLYGAYIPLYSRLGLALLDLNQSESAVGQFRRAVTLEPNNVDNYRYLGLAYGKGNDCAQAIPYFEQVLRLDANNAVAAKGLSDCQAGKPVAIPELAPPKTPLVPPAIMPASVPAVPGNIPIPLLPTPETKPYPSN